MQPHDAVLGYVPGLAGMHDVDDYLEAVPVPGLVVYRYDAPAVLRQRRGLPRATLAVVEASPHPVDGFVLNAEAQVDPDLTAVDAMERLRRDLTARGIVFAMARVKQDLRDDLDKAGFLDKVGTDRVFATLPTAVAAFRRARGPGKARVDS